MALATSISSHQLRYCSSPPPRRPRCRCLRPVATSASPRPEEENIVIVGAGVAGLATALALRRLGVGAAVLEQGEALRAGGTSLTLFKNGWRVLDAVGVADELRAKYLRIQGMRMRSPAAGGRDLREFSFEEEAPGQEVRAVERRVLLETLASKLPPGTISFSSKLKSIAEQGPDGTLLELEDGRQILSKHTDCDRLRRRELAYRKVDGLLGAPVRRPHGVPGARGVRRRPALRAQGELHLRPRRPCRLCPRLLHQSLLVHLLQQTRSRPKDHGPGGAQERGAGPRPRLAVGPPGRDAQHARGRRGADAARGPVALAGPGAGRVVEGRPRGADRRRVAPHDAQPRPGRLLRARGRRRPGAGSGAVEAAMRAYEAERWARVFPLTARAGLVGALVQWENPLVCAARDGVVIPRLVRLGPFLEHTNFECDLIEPAPQSP